MRAAASGRGGFRYATLCLRLPGPLPTTMVSVGTAGQRTRGWCKQAWPSLPRRQGAQTRHRWPSASPSPTAQSGTFGNHRRVPAAMFSKRLLNDASSSFFPSIISNDRMEKRMTGTAVAIRRHGRRQGCRRGRTRREGRRMGIEGIEGTGHSWYILTRPISSQSRH